MGLSRFYPSIEDGAEKLQDLEVCSSSSKETLSSILRPFRKSPRPSIIDLSPLKKTEDASGKMHSSEADVEGTEKAISIQLFSSFATS